MINDEDKFSGDEEDKPRKFDIDVTKNHDNGNRITDEEEDELSRELGRIMRESEEHGDDDERVVYGNAEVDNLELPHHTDHCGIGPCCIYS